MVTKIRFNTYTMTSASYIRDSYQGIIEKFKISAQEKSAEDLTKLLKLLEKNSMQMKNSKILEILMLLLNLSKSPTRAFYNSHYFEIKEDIDKKELTWQDILKEDPLTGDYWQIPNYSSDSSDTQYSEYDTKSEYIDNCTMKNDSFIKSEREILTEKNIIRENEDNFSKNLELNNETIHFNNINVDNFKSHILSRNLKNFGKSQYWNQENIIKIEEINTRFDISNPYTLDIGIIQGVRDNNKIIPDLLLKSSYENEVNIVREILFMLMGYDTAFFKYDKYNKVEINRNLSLKHLTSSCINQLIEYFADKGSKIKDLHSFTKSMLDPNQHVSKTMQSFASSLAEILNYLNKKISNLEENFQNNYIKENVLSSKTTTTILSIKNELSLILTVLSELHIFLNSVLSIDELKYNNTIQACLLLINLYEKMKSYFLIRNEVLFNIYMNIFKNTLEPYISFIENWIFEGTINDPMNEFFIQESQDIENDINSADFWESHYNIKEFNETKIYPTFLKDYVQKILEAGKSFNLIKELNLKIDIQEKSSFLKGFPTLYELWCFCFINSINENQEKSMDISLKENKNNEEMIISNDNKNNAETSIEHTTEDILDIIQQNTRSNIIANDTINSKNNDNQSMIIDMEIYNDDNYSKDINELKSIYPDIIDFYLPNKMQIVKNISKNNIEIDGILSNLSNKYTDSSFSWIPMDNILYNSFEKTIQPPFQYYSELLVNLIQKHKHLFYYVTLLQNVYFQQNGDFWHKFIEIIFNKINKNDLVWQRSNELFSVFIDCLESLSTINNKEKKIYMNNIYLSIPTEKISSYLFPDIKLNFNLPWPINNVITKESLAKYNDIFSYLLFIQIAFQSLTINDWIHQNKKRNPMLSENNTLSKLCGYKIGLRMKFLHFVNGLKNYVFYMVLNNNIKEFQEEIVNYKNFDRIKTEHSKFVKKIWEHCLISLTIIHKNIKDILNMCLIFTEITLNNKKLFQGNDINASEEESLLERKSQEDIYEYQKRVKLYYHRKNMEETNRQRLLKQYQHINEEFDKTLQFILNSLTVLCSHVNVNQDKNSSSSIGALEFLILFLTP